MPFDLSVKGQLEFQHLAGLFASTSLDHAVISMTIRQAAYLYGLVRQRKARKVIEIGRYKGGSTLLIAAAMGGEGEFWSIDLGDKESRLRSSDSRPFDEQIADACRRLGLQVKLVVGDSRTIEVDTGEVDLVFIDGDHSYEGVKNDFERFGKRVRIGGAVLFDDAFDEGLFKTHSDTVGLLVEEIVSEGQFKLVKAVNRLAHLERVE
jgi:predicted O-methyltransferase YrrM